LVRGWFGWFVVGLVGLVDLVGSWLVGREEEFSNTRCGVVGAQGSEWKYGVNILPRKKKGGTN
jgi:hypothetical protein